MNRAIVIPPISQQRATTLLTKHHNAMANRWCQEMSGLSNAALFSSAPTGQARLSQCTLEVCLSSPQLNMFQQDSGMFYSLKCAMAGFIQRTRVRLCGQHVLCTAYVLSASVPMKAFFEKGHASKREEFQRSGVGREQQQKKKGKEV